MQNARVVFFPGINSLRFFAALAVIITHVELLKGNFGYAHCWNNTFIFNLGGLGVYFFFVLSGFLITYLLLVEKETSGRIRIKAFYLRRILRIWPLYYLILILGFFILPHFPALHISYLQQSFEEHFGNNLLLYLIILPNIAYSCYPAVPHIGQVWSIGIEEQFYIFWPWIVAKSKNTFMALVWIVVLLLLLKLFVLLLGNFYATQTWYAAFKNMVAMSKFECMAIGGIGAYYLYTQNKTVLHFLFKPLVLNLSILFIPILIYFTPDKLQDGVHLVFSLLFLIIILNVAANSKIKLSLENKSLSYLGKISYGIYMYHFMIIPMVLYFYSQSGLQLSGLSFNVLLYVMVIGLTVLVSGLSYALIESRFIKLKTSYTVIKSGEKSKEE